MSAATKKKPDAFGSLLAALQALYEDEIHRLVEVYRPRILAGEFSGHERDESEKYLRLERELRETHPWLATERGQHAAVAASRCLARTLEGGYRVDSLDGAECMGHDIMDLAAARRWVKRDEPYALRVA